MWARARCRLGLVTLQTVPLALDRGAGNRKAGKMGDTGHCSAGGAGGTGRHWGTAMSAKDWHWKKLGTPVPARVKPLANKRAADAPFSPLLNRKMLSNHSFNIAWTPTEGNHDLLSPQFLGIAYPPTLFHPKFGLRMTVTVGHWGTGALKCRRKARRWRALGTPVPAKSWTLEGTEHSSASSVKTLPLATVVPIVSVTLQVPVWLCASWV